MTAIAAFLCYFQYTYFEPILSVRLLDFEISDFMIGLFFSLNGVSYMFVSLIISWFTDRYDNQMIISFGIFITGFFHFLIGPSRFLPDSLILMGIGQFLFGGFSILFLITCLPVMINEGITYYPNQKFEVSDMSSGIFNFSLTFGQMVAPIYGSYTQAAVGFRDCATIVGFILISYSLFYL